MPRLPELTIDTAPAATQKAMEAQQAAFGFVLNPPQTLGVLPNHR